MYDYLTGNVSAPSCSAQQAIDLRVAELILGSDDTNLVVDLRPNNVATKDPQYDPFWGSCINTLTRRQW